MPSDLLSQPRPATMSVPPPMPATPGHPSDRWDAATVATYRARALTPDVVVGAVLAWRSAQHLAPVPPAAIVRAYSTPAPGRAVGRHLNQHA